MKKTVIAFLASSFVFFAPTAASAALVINIDQAGSNIFVDGKGSLNTKGLNDGNSEFNSVIIRADLGGVITGSGRRTTLYFNTLKNNGTFGAGKYFTYATTGTGDTFGLYADRGLLLLPTGYLSGSALSGTATYANASFASLGLTQGSYVFNVINGDTITVNVGAVPEPATWALMTLGMGAVAFAMRRRRKVTTTIRLA